MARSQFVTAEQFKALIGYCAVAFVVLLLLAALLPSGVVRTGLVAGWVVFFPVGAWVVFRRGTT